MLATAGRTRSATAVTVAEYASSASRSVIGLSAMALTSLPSNDPAKHRDQRGVAWRLPVAEDLIDCPVGLRLRAASLAAPLRIASNSSLKASTMRSGSGT